MVAGFVLHTLEFGVRWYGTGYFPGNGDYENGLVGSWFAMLFTVYLYFRKMNLRGIALVTVPGTLLLMGFGIMRDPVVGRSADGHQNGPQ